MKLIALQAVPSQCGTIEAGSTFYELDDFLAEDLIVRRVAKRFEEPAALLSSPPASSIALNWPGSTVVIMASGQSMRQIDPERVRTWRDGGATRRVIAINTTYRLAPWADVLYACDGVWWTAQHGGSCNFDEARKFFRLDQMWTQDQATARKLGLQYVRGEQAKGLSQKPATIALGHNSGYQVICLAVLAGATKIVLLGYDMHGKHWHPSHPPPLNRGHSFRLWLEQFPKLAQDVKAKGVDVVNCTPQSALTVFRKGELDEELI